MTTEDNFESGDVAETQEQQEQTEILPTTFREIIEQPELLAALDKLNFTTPTPVQAKTMPFALTGRDLIVQAKTGSGKTLSYVLPFLARYGIAAENTDRGTTIALLLAPTRELAVQIREVLYSLTSEVRPVLAIGGVDVKVQIEELSHDARLVIGTPGRVLDLLQQKALKLKRCEYFVLDEADEMLSMGFLEDVRAILSRLPDGRQGLFVSATITPRVEMLANSFLTTPEIVIVDSPNEDLPPIEHCYCEVGGDLMAKPHALCDLIETLNPTSAIIFCNTKSDTQLVEALLRRRGFDARRINSDLTQSQRTKIMTRIRSRELRFLVATDIAARGLDLDQIDLVINFSIHDQPELYVHRTGRTGRAGRSGKAISLVGPRDFGAFHFLTKVLNVEFLKIPLPSDDEVSGSRLAHLHEILRKSHLEIKERDRLVAKQLLKEMAGITDPSEDFETVTAKLCRHVIEHFISNEAASLDEEVAPENTAQQRADENEWGGDENSRSDRRGERRGRDNRGRESGREGSGRDGNRNDRGRGREERRDNRHDEGRGQGARNDRERDYGDERRESRGGNYDENRNENRGNRNERSRDDRPRRDQNRGYQDDRQSRDRRPRRDQQQGSGNDDYRIYIGQGSTHGMTPELFTSLAQEMANVPAHALKHLCIRSHYGYVDTKRGQAESLIQNLNGIEYNGALLPIEVACVINEGRREQGRPDRG